MMKSPLKLLMVEDLATDAELILRELRRAGIACEAQRVETEAEFRLALDTLNPDLILSDFTLPSFDGLRALDISRERRGNTPFIYVSGTIGEERAIESLKRGATDYVLKTNLSRLAPAARRALQEAGERADRRVAEESLRLAASALENTAEGVMIADAQWRIVSINKAFVTITGYTAEEVVGGNPMELQSEQREALFYARILKSLKRIGHWQGEIWNRRKDGAVYPALLSLSTVDNEAGETTHYVAVFTDISRFKQYEERLDFLAYHDALTHLPNRILFQDRLSKAIDRALRNDSWGALFFIDLDQFKRVNDSLGHAVGDQLLQAVATRLSECVREADAVSRLGGDEFTVVVEDLHDPQDGAIVAQKLLDAFARPFRLAGHELFASASIGIGSYPDDGSDVQTLLRNADVAMYRAKAQGRNTYRFFSAEMNAQALENLVMANSLRQALERQEFLLYYQPLINLETQAVVGVEALIRWQHPERGLISPARFIPLAEETGLIGPIGEWVLRSVCAQARAWHLRHAIPLRAAVNLSAFQFRKPELTLLIRECLDETGLDPSLLEIEITESMVMSQPEQTEILLDELNAMGIRIAIDDFGTGYSSLSYLKRFPIHYLKIDQSFVRDIPHDTDDCAITRAIIAMAKSLKLEVIAEGVEKPEQFDFLRALGCEEGQGMLFGKPQSAQEISALLDGSEPNV